MTPYEWAFTCLHRHSVGEVDDVVNAIDWRVISTDESAPVSVYGRTYVQYDASSQFVDFANLTEAQVIEWIHTTLGDEEFNAIFRNLDAKAQQYKARAAATMATPW